jgi:cell wall-associated NlpC family hydrolase
VSLDKRICLARPDLADERLEGLVRAKRFAATRPMRCVAASTPIQAAPDAASEQQDQLLLGEGFDVLEESGGWAWGQALRDGYVGYVQLERLGPREGAPTHRIKALRTYGFSRPDLKSAPIGVFSINALVRAGRSENNFLEAGEAGWIYAPHLASLDEFETDYVAVAHRFLGAPYLWGGRDSLGLDCSGLVQQAFYACGRSCPRDTDQQMAVFERAAPLSELSRGDLVFWRGHMGIMCDGLTLLHANAFHMAVAIEPLAAAVTRIKASGSGELVALRRP